MPPFSDDLKQIDSDEIEVFEYQPVLGIELYIQMEEIMK